MSEIKTEFKSGFVTIIGRPNSGKSTLLNRLIGTHLAEVSPKAQMTRNRIQGILNTPEGQLVFVDTPGIHRAKAGGMNEALLGETRMALEDCQCVWFLIDPTSTLQHESVVLPYLKKLADGCQVFLVQTKVDIGLRNLSLLESIKSELLKENPSQNLQIFLISAKTHEGLPELLAETWKATPVHPKYFSDDDQVSDLPHRFFVAEKIRRQLYRLLGDELPYSTAVKIERFDEASRPVRIEAKIIVERPSQLGMVVGNKGHKIKEIGTEARQDIQKFLGYPIFLGLKVECVPNWTKHAASLKALGYLVPEKGRR